MLRNNNNKQTIARYAPPLTMALATGLFYSGFFWHAAHSPVFKLGASAITSLGATATLGSAFLSLPMGHISDTIGRRTLRLVGCFMFITTALLTTFAFEIWHLYVLMLFASCSMSLFWPATQADLYDNLSVKERRRVLGRYNCIWSAAITATAPISGLLYANNVFLPFLLTSAFALSSMALIMIIRLPKHADHHEPVIAEDEVREYRTLYFLRIAYIANCIVWGSRATMGFILPVINENYGRTSFQNGMAVASASVLLVVGFILLLFNNRWKYRLRELFTGQIVVMAGIILSAVFMDNLWLMMVFLGVSGIGAAITYTSSQFYSLDTRKNAGKRIGINESLLNAGAIVIPLLAGMLAWYSGEVAWAFYFAALMIVVGLFVQIVIAKKTSPVLPDQQA